MQNTRVFVSYVQENRKVVTRLVNELRKAGSNVWFDRDALPPGVFWREEIRAAVRDHEFFLACFSEEYRARERTYMNEELELAIEEIRLRGQAPWFIPVVLSGEVPDRTIGAGRTLRDIQFVDLSGAKWADGIQSLIAAVHRGSGVGPSSIPTGTMRDASTISDDSWAGIDLDRRVLRHFLNENRLARHLDSKIAGFTRSKQLHEVSELTVEADVAALKVVGVHTTTQLERVLKQHKRVISEWAEEWLGGTDSFVSQGVCLTYLGYIILASQNNTQRIFEFMAASHISPADDSAVQRIELTYRQFAQ